jgi:hypothetical protein
LVSTIDVFNLLGKKVLSMSPKTGDVSIDGSRLKAKLYFTYDNTIDGNATLKIIKK